MVDLADWNFVKKNIIYIVHGQPRYYDEARFSLLTLLHLLKGSQSKDYKIWVWTPRPHLLPRHEAITYQNLEQARLPSMRGPLDLVHRIKLVVLAEAAKIVGEHFVYVDGDTRWLHLPDQEFDQLKGPPGSSRELLFMNGIDGTLSESFKSGYFQYLNENSAALKGRFGIADPPWNIWNAGVLGMKCHKAEKLLLESIRLCDALVPWLTPRIYVEQLALNLIAPMDFDIESFQRPIDHYWDCSFEASIYVRDFFASPTLDSDLSAQAEAAYNLAWERKFFWTMQKQPKYRFLRWKHRLRASLHKRIMDLKARRLRK